MTIAEQIKAFHDSYEDALVECEEKAIEKFHDDYVVTFVFADSSVIVANADAEEMLTYGCKA